MFKYIIVRNRIKAFNNKKKMHNRLIRETIKQENKQLQLIKLSMIISSAFILFITILNDIIFFAYSNRF